MTAIHNTKQDLNSLDDKSLQSRLQEPGVKYALASYVNLHGWIQD